MHKKPKLTTLFYHKINIYLQDNKYNNTLRFPDVCL